MKKGFLSVLLTLGMVLMMLPTTAYAGKAYCETCGKWVGTISTYEYKDGGYHWKHVSCAECDTNISNPREKHNWSGTATCTSGQDLYSLRRNIQSTRTCLELKLDFG